MKNKVLKNVVLLACVLGLVLFPITSYGTDYDYSSVDSFILSVNTAFPFSNNHISGLFVSQYDSTVESLYQNLISTYNIDEDEIIMTWASYYTGYTNRIFIEILTCNEFPDFGYIYDLNNSTTSPYINIYLPAGSRASTYIDRYNAASSTPHQYTVSENFVPTTTTQIALPGSYYNKRTNFLGIKPQNIVIADNNPSSYTDRYTLNTTFGGSGGGDDPDQVSFSSVVTPIPAQLYAQLFNAYMYARWQEISTKWSTEYANASDFEWVFDNNEDAQLFAGLMGIGSVLESYAVNSYGFYDNVSLNLANGMTMLSSLGTGINDISDRLALAFPDDQAELNDSIAETLMDDTNNTGLTAEKVSNAKSDFDDGISTYEIDTSGSTYSTPFAAIRGGDWSFWSQTTLDNMGSGYSYTYQQTRNTKASNESDIYDENSRSLFNLLGW